MEPEVKKKRKKWKIVLLVILDVILVLALAAVILFCYMTSGWKAVKLDRSDLGIEPRESVTWEAQTEPDSDASGEETEKDSAEQKDTPSQTAIKTVKKTANIKNIAFFGIDSTDNQAWYGDQYRSDSIIIFSVDTDNNTIKITNILRDSKVPIEGHDPQKINAAYKYGFAPLAIKTLNQNFHMDIEDYITIDFAGIEKLVDMLGGVTLELTAEEAALVPGTTAGVNNLNGEQAMLYSRIRKIDSDYYRASRQQYVLEKIFEKLKAIPVTQYPSTIRDLISCMETSLTYGDVSSLVNKLDLKTVKLETNTIPDYDYEKDLWGGIDETGSWVWIYDIEAAAKRLHEFIYGNS